MIADRFARSGKTLIGCGDAAIVWGRPSDSWVVKIGFDGDDAWPEWAGWCRENPGPHVPVIFSCQVFEHDGRREGFVGILERLERTDVAQGWLAAERLLKRDPLRLAAMIEPAHPGVAAMLRAAAASFADAKWDLAPSNWMTRVDNTIVLIDPLSRLHQA